MIVNLSMNPAPNSLIDEQLLSFDAKAEDFQKKVRYLSASIVVLFVFLSVAFYSIFPLLNNNIFDQESKVSTQKTVKSSGVFVPNEDQYNKQRFFGKISTEKIGEEDFFKLQNENGELIGYLSSDKIDLTMMQGLNLVVLGKYGKEKIADQKLIIVEEIEFN